MTLIEIMIKHNIVWPDAAQSAYQSSIDSEIYFFDRYRDMVGRVRRRNDIEKADKRGINSLITRAEYEKHRSVNTFFEQIQEAGGPTAYKESQRARMIKRIENGLRKDFDIDSPELAEEMFNKGWRR